MKTLITIILALIISVASYSQIPDNIPAYIQNIYYFDPTNPSAGDGTIGNPWNSVESIPSVHMPGSSWVTPKSAILFKRGTVMFGNNPRTTEWHFTADSLYFGSYGTGEMAKLLFNSRNRSFRIFGTGTRISHLHVANLDTMNYSQVVSLRVQDTSGPRGRMHIDSLIISQGFRALNFSTFEYAYIENSLIYNINHDGVYSHSCDTIHFNGVHFHTINKDWAWNRSESQSGGDAIQVEGTSSDRIRLVIVENSILDKSKYGNKFNLIVNGTDSTIVRNTIFYGHPHSTKGIYGSNVLVDGCEFYGFDRAIWNTSGERPNRVYNSLFVGFGAGATFEGNTTQDYLLHGTYADIYNCTFVNVGVIWKYPGRNLNVRNSIFYNVSDPWWLGVRAFHGSGNIHYNANGQSLLGLHRYASTNDYIIADPMFIDPYVNWIETVMVPGTGNGAWSYRTLERIPNLRLAETSPARNAADPIIYDPTATFTYGANSTSDPVYVRKYAELYVIDQDIEGNARPYSTGYDIGAYEWQGEQLPPVTPDPPAPVVEGKPRVIIISDISGSEPDDRQSFVRYLLYANEFDTEGIIGAGSVFGPNRGDLERFNLIIDGYGAVRNNLILHADGYPTAQSLRDVVFQGQQGTVGMANVGNGLSNNGSNHIIQRLTDPDPRRLWVLGWGGLGTLAQALWDLKYNSGLTESQVNALVDKLAVYDVAGQDDAGPWIAKTFPNIYYIRSANQFSGFAQGHIGAAQGGDLSIANDTWYSNNIRNQGTYGALFPARVYMFEGDTPSFLHLINNGLSDPFKPHYGSWGGRFTKNKALNPARYIHGSVNQTPYFDFYMHDDAVDNWSFGGTLYNNKYSPLYRWRDGYQLDFAARMKWTMNTFANANHNPQVVVNGNSGKEVMYIPVPESSQIILNASASTDPDGNALTYNWFYYPEPSTYNGSVTINNANTSIATVQVPANSTATDIHVILQVKDNGVPALSSYRRIVLSPGIPSFVWTNNQAFYNEALTADISNFNELLMYINYTNERLFANLEQVKTMAEITLDATFPDWGVGGFTPINFSMNNAQIRNNINNQTALLWLRHEMLKDVITQEMNINVPARTGWNNNERNVIIGASPAQYRNSFRHNANLFISNVQVFYNIFN